MIKLNANNNKIIKDNVDFHNISNFRAKIQKLIKKNGKSINFQDQNDLLYSKGSYADFESDLKD